MTTTGIPVHGQVVDALGHPVAQARVGWVDGPVPLPEVMALSDAQGHFTLVAPVAGAYQLQCSSDAHGQASVQVQARKGGVTVRLALPG